jgi:hypothetical protein
MHKAAHACVACPIVTCYITVRAYYNLSGHYSLCDIATGTRGGSRFLVSNRN